MDDNLYEPFLLTGVQQAYILGRIDKLDFGGIAAYRYAEVEYHNLDVVRLEKAINTLIKRHIGLRATFTEKSQQYLKEVDYYQVQENHLKSDLEVINIRDQILHNILDYTRFPLFHFEVSYLTSNKKAILHIGWDLLIVDGLSIKILINELDLLYKNPFLVLPKLDVRFRDYITWVDRLKDDPDYKDHLDEERSYWQQKIPQFNLNINLPFIHKYTTPLKYSSLRQTIDQSIWQKFVKQAKEHQLSPMRALLHLYGIVLCYYSNQSHMCINVTLGKRPEIHPDINRVVGDFTQLELFDFFNDNVSFVEGCKTTCRNLTDDLNNLSYIDGIEIQNLVRREFKFDKGKVLAPIVFTGYMKNFAVAPHLDDDEIKLRYLISQTPHVWLDNKIAELNGDCLIWWDYIEGLFADDILNNMQNTYCELIQFFAINNWDQPLPSLIPKVDLALIEKANSVTQKLDEGTLFSYYERYIGQNNYLDKIAVIDAGKQCDYSYQQLFVDSDLFAKYLYRRFHSNLKHSSLIGILSEKGYNQVISALAIMKSGFAYLPLNILWPSGTMQRVIDKGMVRVVLLSKKQYANEELRKVLSATCELLVIEDLLEEVSNGNQRQHGLTQVKLPHVKADDVAYVIFTSGSTGSPKGVTINHRGVVNTILAVNRRFKITCEDKVLALSGLSFDLSVYDIFGMLFVGGSIVFPDQAQFKDASYWCRLIVRYQITIWNTVPQLASVLADEIGNNNLDGQYLRLFLLSGDRIPLQLPNQLKNYFTNAQIISLGGATEGSIWSIWYEIKHINSNWLSIPYGVAMPNQNMYVLNEHGKHCPVGVTGEIHIGGVGVALSYWGDEEKTNYSYFSHPTLGRLYKTGDLGRWHIDGYIEFIGRIDNQIKINGYRVELGEIENKLLMVPGIQQAITKVVTHKQQNYVVAYLLPDNKSDMKDSLSENTGDGNKTQVKLQTLGIKHDVVSEYQLNIQLNKEQYVGMKSYRNYINEPVDSEQINSIVRQTHQHIKELFCVSNANKTVTLQDIEKLLSVLSCYKFNDHMLPKYLYPSAGSSYAIRCYLNSKSINDKSGYYYFHPLNNTMSVIKPWNKLIDATSCDNCIDFIVYWPAITSLYPNDARRFACLEVGHMLNLLVNKAYEIGIAISIEIYEKDLDEDNTLLARAIINKHATTEFNARNVKEVLYFKEGLSVYKSDFESIDLTKMSVFFQVDAYGGSVLRNGGGLITLYGANSVGDLIYSGFYLQQLQSDMLKYGYGSCSLGRSFKESMLYAMVFGRINLQLKDEDTQPTKQLTLKKCVEEYITNELPGYMLPYAYVMIDRVPLTTNGKVAVDQLPQIDIFSNSSYIAPQDKLEHQLVTIYAQILKSSVEKISIVDDFFRLGGNSVLAMQLVSLINSKLHVDLKLVDMYATSSNSIRGIKQVILDKLNLSKEIDGTL